MVPFEPAHHAATVAGSAPASWTAVTKPRPSMPRRSGSGRQQRSQEIMGRMGNPRHIWKLATVGLGLSVNAEKITGASGWL